MSFEEKIREIEDEIKKTPSNKATQGHLGKLKAKLAVLRDKSDLERSVKKSGTGSHGYNVKKLGNATSVFVGFPSVGKSTILNRLTNAESRVAAYEFTTLDVVPGVMKYRGAYIQLLDVPGILEDASAGRGRGREVLAAVRGADMVLIVVDIKKLNQLEIIKNEILRSNIRPNVSPPDILSRKKDRGGVNITSTVKQAKLSKDTMNTIAREMGYMNADIVLREEVTSERLIDGLAKNRVYMPMLVVVNKIDTVSNDELMGALSTVKDKYVAISAENGENLELLRQKIFGMTRLVRIYMKPPGKPADRIKPLIMKGAPTIEAACAKTRADSIKYLKSARVWGPSAKFAGQRVGPDHLLQDEDELELAFSK